MSTRKNILAQPAHWIPAFAPNDGGFWVGGIALGPLAQSLQRFAPDGTDGFRQNSAFAPNDGGFGSGGIPLGNRSKRHLK